MADVRVDASDKDAAGYYMPARDASYRQKFREQPVEGPEITDYTETLKNLLQQPTIASKKWVYDQFDSDAQGNTVVAPGAGAGIVQIEGTNKAIAMTTDCNSRYMYLDPETGGKIAVA